MPKNTSGRFRNLITFLLTSVIVLTALVYFSTSQHNINYRVHFYDNDQIIATIDKRGNESVSHSDLMTVANLLGDSITGYDINWSKSKDELFFVDFECLKTDTNLYLFKSLHEYDVKLNIDSGLEILDVEKDNFKFGSNYLFKVNKLDSLIDKDIVVTVNGKSITKDINDIYHIEKIANDLVIDITYKEVINIDLKQHVFNYTGSSMENNLLVDAPVDIPIDELEIKYYADSELTKEVIPFEVGTYYTTIHYTGTNYYIPDVTTNLIIVKAMPNVVADDVEVTYDSEYHRYLVDNVTTNSDGKVTVSKVYEKLPGIYEVVIKVEETTHYLPYEGFAKLIINKMLPEITHIPNFGYVFVNQKLNELDLSECVANIPGTFSFVNSDSFPTIKNKHYEIKFEPSDSTYYQSITTTVELDIVTQDQIDDIVSNKK